MAGEQRARKALAPPAAGEPHEEPMIVGAIPFEIDKPAALTAPRSVIRSPGPLEPPAR